MHARAPFVFLFDVDNTLLDNDTVTAHLRGHLEKSFGHECAERYFRIFEALRVELGYADYLGSLQRYRHEMGDDPHLLQMSTFLIEYPFADRLFPGAREAVQHARQQGEAHIVSDGDVVFQPWKIRRAGLWDAFGGHVLIYVHKEKMLDDIERRHPADHYVVVDDKLRLLAAFKRVWKERVTTVFVRQGHYAHDPKILASEPPADVTLESVSELQSWTARDLVTRASS